MDNSSRATQFLKCLMSEERVKNYLDALASYDRVTYGHSIRVGLLSVRLGFVNGVSERELCLLGYTGLLHDIGKIDTPLEVIAKNGKLTSEERELIEYHPRLGFIDLQSFDDFEVQRMVVCHHENKTNPYPRRGGDRRRSARNDQERRSDDLRLRKLGQITSVCDIYDALAHRRSYKSAFPREKIEAILYEEFTGDRLLIEQVMSMVQ